MGYILTCCSLVDMAGGGKISGNGVVLMGYSWGTVGVQLRYSWGIVGVQLGYN